MAAQAAPIDPHAATPVPEYWTHLGMMYRRSVEHFLASTYANAVRGDVQLLFTSATIHRTTAEALAA
ncbi:MAG: hypothetical protein ACRDLQ_04750 [Solirubrobacterales bacterium]